MGAADFNGDGKTDILWQYLPADTNNDLYGLCSVWYMDGTNATDYLLLDPDYSGDKTHWKIAGTGGFGFQDKLAAQVTNSPPSINLIWPNNPVIPWTVQKRLLGDTNWSTLQTNVTASHYLDTNIVAGNRYEYQLLYANSGYAPYDHYILAGLDATPIESRGKVVLLVDQTLATALTNDLVQLKQDLVGDGWQVLRHDVARHVDGADYSANTNNLATIKGLIKSDYTNAPNDVKAVFIVGHVTIPYSGYVAVDGHDGSDGTNYNACADHRGAWPADVFYGDMVGTWTDGNTNIIANSCRPELNIAPNDGKFDNNSLPAAPKLAVGRLDFARMPIFTNPPAGVTAKSETQLIQQYLAKDHNYRFNGLTISNRAIVNGYWPEPERASLNRVTAQHVVRNSARWFGLDFGNVVRDDLFSKTNSDSYFLGALTAGGGYGSIGTYVSSNLIHIANEPKIGFYVLTGSYFADWNSDDNLLRSVLATPNYGLASMWGYQTQVRFENMALGGMIGDGLVRTETWDYQHGQYGGGSRVHTLLGDPTLRLHRVSPPSVPMLTDYTTLMVFSWTASPDADVKYNVYAADSSDGPFTRQNADPLTVNYYYMSHPAPHPFYQARGVKAVTTGSGTYTNISQAIFVNAP
jgi:hypothetical protein